MADGAEPHAAISIHALLAESDFGTACATPYFFQFLSTLSLRRATITNIQRNGNTDISIHALLAESDSCPLARPFHCHDFYPRSPCGERHSHTKVGMHQILFLSTLSLRRATIVLDLFNFHEPNFYPRSPCGERPGQRRSSCAR